MHMMPLAVTQLARMSKCTNTLTRSHARISCGKVSRIRILCHASQPLNAVCAALVCVGTRSCQRPSLVALLILARNSHLP